MNVLIWHVHGSWMNSFLQGKHTYLLPCTTDRGADGLGRARTWDWPSSAVEVPLEKLADQNIDVVIIQRPRDIELCEKWLGEQRLGRDIPMIWLEHNAPQGQINAMRHPAADRKDVVVVHVSKANALFWDTGSTATRIVEHGIPDPGYRWSGEFRSAAVVINDPVRRGRVTGTDLLPQFGAVAHLDVMGMRTDQLSEEFDHPSWLCAYEDLTQAELHKEMPRRRCYLHTYRWTSLGLSLIEAMTMGMPVVAIGTLEVPDAVPKSCGVTSTDINELCDAVAGLMADPEWGMSLGETARRHALDRYGLERFLSDWDEILEEV